MKIKKVNYCLVFLVTGQCFFVEALAEKNHYYYVNILAVNPVYLLIADYVEQHCIRI